MSGTEAETTTQKTEKQEWDKDRQYADQLRAENRKLKELLREKEQLDEQASHEDVVARLNEVNKLIARQQDELEEIRRQKEAALAEARAIRRQQQMEAARTEGEKYLESLLSRLGDEYGLEHREAVRDELTEQFFANPISKQDPATGEFIADAETRREWIEIKAEKLFRQRAAEKQQKSQDEAKAKDPAPKEAPPAAAGPASGAGGSTENESPAKNVGYMSYDEAAAYYQQRAREGLLG